MIQFKQTSESTIEVIAWCVTRNDYHSAGYLMVLADDFWYYCSCIEAPALCLRQLVNIADKLDELNKGKPE